MSIRFQNNSLIIVGLCTLCTWNAIDPTNAARYVLHVLSGIFVSRCPFIARFDIGQETHLFKRLYECKCSAQLCMYIERKKKSRSGFQMTSPKNYSGPEKGVTKSMLLGRCPYPPGPLLGGKGRSMPIPPVLPYPPTEGTVAYE